jgi:HSP20 family protein
MTQMTQTAERPQTATTPRAATWVVPRANILENKDAYILDLEMPGVSKEGVEVTVDNNELTIIGHRAVRELKADAVYRETRPLDYRRVFDLDPSIDTGRISAKVEQGVLTLTLPKAESLKPRKISVTE